MQAMNTKQTHFKCRRQTFVHRAAAEHGDIQTHHTVATNGCWTKDDQELMKTRFSKNVRLFFILCWAALAVGPRVSAQTSPGLDLKLYAGLTITGAVGAIYSIEYVTDVAQTNSWRCLEFLQPPANPFLWADKSAPATGQRFYRAVVFAAPTNLVFIPPGTFRMGSPTNEVDRDVSEGPQTAVTISHGFWMGKYEVTQG